MLEGEKMKKKLIILGSIIAIILFLVVICLFVKDNEKVESLTEEEKQLLISNLTIENESILTSEKTITVEADIINNNDRNVKIDKLNITLLNEYEKDIKTVNVKINKNVKSGKSIKFKKIITIDNIEPRVFTKYKIII